ncbi:CpsD/CapB family tyrosine-protein kinase [Enterococcus ratti]|uniref:Tyrosine-protein kinase CpsD n=1 Tax=Enterococcus ratti TaxID=150033 RepID=A0A1L8WLJ0_9ENTE|nr:CpsD/CapB family tyrosine-protein kinase [Enterococcus ratti]OJG81652.1 capsular exopolysaccharide family protein [Enterococcus ratti]
MRKTRRKRKTRNGAVRKNLITITDKTSPITERYRTIRTNIQYSFPYGEKLQTLVITSPGAGEGKSTTAANLAVVYANFGQRVLIIDADMRKPTLDKIFSLEKHVGLSTLLGTNVKVEECIQESFEKNLFIMTSGPKPPNPAELLGSVRLEKMIEELKNMYDVIIFDTPPLSAVTDAQILASKVDATIMVVSEKLTKKTNFQIAKHLLELVNANVLGVVYNASKEDEDQGYYYYGS